MNKTLKFRKVFDLRYKSIPADKSSIKEEKPSN